MDFELCFISGFVFVVSIILNYSIILFGLMFCQKDFFWKKQTFA